MHETSPSLLFTIAHWFVSAFALLVTSKIVPGFKITGFRSALWASFVIGIANILIWPLLMFLTLPINILTLGLFTFVVNGAVLMICAGLIKGFELKGWFAAIIGAVVLSGVGLIFHALTF
jgi:putative membrane protein